MWGMPRGSGYPYLRGVGIEIRTLGDLQQIGTGVNGWRDDAYYRLVNDIDASASAGWNDPGTDMGIREGFRPIQEFNGLLDGCGHTISGLVINRPTEDCVGLFSVLMRGEVKNLALGTVAVYGRDRVGGLFGEVNCEVRNLSKCFVSGRVSGGSGVGGMAGVFDAYVKVSQCGSEGSVSGVSDVGGLFGCAAAFCTPDEVWITLEACFSRADVSGESVVGGLIGYCGCGLRRCFATGTVTGIAVPSVENGWQMGYAYGGVAGVKTSIAKVEECFSSGRIKGGMDGLCVGGLMGVNLFGDVTNCLVLGNVDGCSVVGRLIGMNGRQEQVLDDCPGAVVLPDLGGGDVWNCFATGSCNAFCDVGANDQRSALVASCEAGQQVCGYWDMDSEGVPISDQPVNRDNGGRTGAEMRRRTTFVGWDFSETWGIQENAGYPYLLSLQPKRLAFDVQGGALAYEGNFVSGTLYGFLPTPVRSGYAFGGWWTGLDGTGEQVLPTDIVPGADGLWTLYAKWTAILPPQPPPPTGGSDDNEDNDDVEDDDVDDDEDEGGNEENAGYLCDPAGDAALVTVGAYDGYLYAAAAFGGGEASAVRGTLSLKVTGLAGKLTAKAVLQGGSVSFKGTAWSAPGTDGTRHAELDAAGGERLDLFVRQNRIWGTLSGGKAGAGLSLDGARNRFAERGDTAAAPLLEAFKGYYTVALPAAEGGTLSASDEVDAAPQGAGYLTVTVGAKGSAKIAGVLADGTKVTQAGRLLLFDGCGTAACVPFFAPLYAKKGWAGGLLWIDPGTRTVETDRNIGWLIRWENPGRGGPDGFSLLLDACGGFYGTGASLASAYLFGAETEGTAYFDALGEPWDWAALPEAVPVAAAGARLSVAKGAKPKKVSEEGDVSYEYDEVNPANVTLTFASRTGLFKGKFNLYCDYEDATGKVVHKAVSVPYAGVLAPVRGGAFDGLPAGLGHCLIPDSDPAVKPYRLKRSRPVWLEGQ